MIASAAASRFNEKEKARWRKDNLENGHIQY